jgi:hypothetical protein
MMQLEKERRDFERRLQQMNEQQRKRTDKIMIGLAIAGGLLAIAKIFAALAALTPDSILFQWFH